MNLKIILPASRVIPFPNEHLEIEQSRNFDAKWQTPGVYLAQKIASNSLVRFVGEKVQIDYLQVIVVIDDDLEELLDKIFSIEQELYSEFEGLRFDIRIRVILPAESIVPIEQSTITRYNRDSI